MNLYMILKEKDKYFLAEYFPTTDLANNFNLKKIFDLKEEIVNYFKNYKYEINKEHFVDYLLCLELSKYNKDRKLIYNDYLETFDFIFEYINLVLKNVNKDDVLKYIDNKADLTLLDFDLKKIYYNFIKDNKEKITFEILKKSINEICYYFLDDYKIWIDILIDHNLQFELLNDLSSKIISRLETSLEYIALLKSKNYNISSYVIELNKIMEECLQTNENNTLHSQLQYSTILSYYKKMNLPEANKYEKKYDILIQKGNEWLEKNGHEMKLDFEIEKFIESVKNVKHAGMQIIYYTHEPSEINKQKVLISFYESAKNASIKNRPIMLDLCSSIQPSTKIYDNWLQECYALTEILHLNIISFVFGNNELLEKYFVGMNSFFKSIVEYYVEKDNLIQQLQTILSMQRKCIEQKYNKAFVKDFCKSTLNFVETLLREIYYENNKEKFYVDKENLTLGILLDSSRNMLTNTFSKDFLDGMRYYLSHDTNSKGQKVGLDLRNKMNHANAIIDSEYNQVLFIRVTLIFTTLINEMYLKTIE